jgi:uncharacterized membrane protein YphA (DoxX/SURF4 family)
MHGQISFSSRLTRTATADGGSGSRASAQFVRGDPNEGPPLTISRRRLAARRANGSSTTRRTAWCMRAGGLDQTAVGFRRLGFKAARLQAVTAGSAEFFGGLLLALGLATAPAAVALIGVMTTATVAVHFRNGLWNTKGGSEYNLVLIAAIFAWSASARARGRSITYWAPN